MAQLVPQLLQALAGVPAPVLYAIVAIWVGVESAGIGVPIEPVMIFAGTLATGPVRHISLSFAITFTVLSCLVFASIAYLIGARVGTARIARIGRFIGLTETRAEHVELWLRRRGLAGIVVARVTPIIRTFSSYAMGAADVPPHVFALGTVVGSTIYCGFWIMLGSLVGARYQQVLATFSRYQGYALAGAGVVVVGFIVLHHLWGRSVMRRMEHSVAGEVREAEALAHHHTHLAPPRG